MGDVVPSSGAPFLTTTLRTSCGVRCQAFRARSQNGFQSKLGLPFRCAAQHKTVAVLEGEQLTDRLNLIGRDAVGWKFVGVEDALDAGQLGGTCKFPAQPGS